MSDSRPILIYDAQCRLCVFSKKIIAQWDTKCHIRFLHFQDQEAQRLVADFASASAAGSGFARPVAGCGGIASEASRPQHQMDAMWLVDANGFVSSGVDAFRGMLPSLPMGQVVELIFKLPGFSVFAKRIYRIIAKNRIRWFGKHHCMQK
ncbi:MAG: DUF393 domain-containing protein [Nitrospirae bacterium]|nr:DUF393 domain-containing protein [Candidatus Troglogloeales bacterium]